MKAVTDEPTTTDRELEPVAVRLASPRLAEVAAVVVLAAVYAAFASTTRPFTVGGDVATAVGFVPVGLLVARSVRRRRAAGEPHRRSFDAVTRRRLAPWLIALAVLVGWEIAMYFAGFGGHRSADPTISSLYDQASTSPLGRGIFLFLWQLLGWGMFRR